MAKKKNSDILTEEVEQEETSTAKASGGAKATKAASSSSTATTAAQEGSATVITTTKAPTTEAIRTEAAVEVPQVVQESVDLSTELAAVVAEDTAEASAATDATQAAATTVAETVPTATAADATVAKTTPAATTEATTETDTSTDTSTDASTAAVLDNLLASAASTISQSVSSKADAESVLSDYSYTQSDAVTEALAALEAYTSSAPDEYTSTYQEQIDALLDQILNREDFSYDFDADPLYQQYKNQYEHSAMLAMQDTMAEAQSMTGGYGSSYAVQAASGAYQDELNQLTGVMPELYELAYSLYADKGSAMIDQLSAVSEQEELSQQQYQDLVANYYTGLEASTEAAENAYDKDYGQYQDSYQYLQDLLEYYAGQEQQAVENDAAQLAYELAVKEYEESVRQFEAELALKQSQYDAENSQWWAEFNAAQAAASAVTSSTSSTSSSSSTSSTSSSSSSDFNASSRAIAIRTQLAYEMSDLLALPDYTEAEVNDWAENIISIYYRSGEISKEEANWIGQTYGVTF